MNQHPSHGLELPTWLLAFTLYGGFAALTWFHASVPLWVLIPLGAYLVAWHGSFQHEALHGHPTRFRWVNKILAAWPLNGWLPYDLYRSSHLLHHRDSVLTDPYEDPESYYVSNEDWARLGWWGRSLRWALQTVAGRLILGPVVIVGRFWGEELQRLSRGDFSHVPAWASHLLYALPLMLWLHLCGLTPLKYVLCFIYPGVGLGLLRAYTEHRVAESPKERIAIVEAAWPWGLLFLNNNLHSIHHAEPNLPWYRIPARYRSQKARWLEENGQFYFSGYLEILNRFAFTPKDSPEHPGRLPARPQPSVPVPSPQVGGGLMGAG